MSISPLAKKCVTPLGPRASNAVVRCGLLFVAVVLLNGCEPSKGSVGCSTCGFGADQFEVIVVGSGAGGGPLASRLARGGLRVLLIEAGDDVGGNLKYQVPAMHALSTEAPGMAWWYFVQHSRDAAIDQTDSKMTTEGVLYPRGSALGGSTAVNAMVTVLPSRSDWNRLAELTDDSGFRADAMDKYIDRVREWLTIELADPRLGLGDSKVNGFLTAAAATFSEANGEHVDLASTAASLGTVLQHDLNSMLRSGETTGLYRLPLATKDGHRNGTRERILDTVDQGYPLTVMTGALVTRVLWHPKTPGLATGVEFVRKSNVYGASLAVEAAPATRESAFASREVVLAAGSFNSPQLLMLSGVGEPNALRAVGIEPVIELAGVGQNLQDRYEAPVVHTFTTPVDVVAPCKLGSDDPNDPCLNEWQQGRGVYETPGFLASVLMRSAPQNALADLQVFGVPSDARGYYPGYSKDSAASKEAFTWLLLKAHTQNRDGVVSLTSSDPFSRPSIAFNSYDERNPLGDPDLTALVEGVKFVRRMQKYMRDSPVTEVWPGPALQSDADLAKWVRKESWGHHACCTDKMGVREDPSAVIDSRFRVIGAQHLRVVDASAFPEIPGTFIALPTFMLAERAADVMLEDVR